jgi:hypothetical protein
MEKMTVMMVLSMVDSISDRKHLLSEFGERQRNEELGKGRQLWLGNCGIGWLNSRSMKTKSSKDIKVNAKVYTIFTSAVLKPPVISPLLTIKALIPPFIPSTRLFYESKHMKNYRRMNN